MITRTLSSKNQVTIPKAVREQLGIKSHQAISFQSIHHQIVIKPVKASNHLSKVRRFWKRMAENTRKYGSDDTGYDWGKDKGDEKLDNK